MMTDEQINKVASKLLRESLKDIGFQRATTESEEDFDGTSIIRVTAHFKHAGLPSDRLIDALHEIRAELLRKGEERFVFLDSKYPQEAVADEDME